LALHRKGKKRSYEVKRLTPGTTYHFLVKAANKYGAGGFSRVASFMTQGSAPKKKGFFPPLDTKTLKRVFFTVFCFSWEQRTSRKRGSSKWQEKEEAS